MAYILSILAVLFVYTGVKKFRQVLEGTKRLPVPPKMFGALQIGIGAALFAWAASIFMKG